MKIELNKPTDLLSLAAGSWVTKRNLFDLIQYSKVSESQYWEGSELQIGNTPQQGINWIGAPPACYAVIIKTRLGSYEEDGWANEEKTAYNYSFKAKREGISYSEKANAVLINQPQYLYPILLFTEGKDSWVFEGAFAISEIESKYVVLKISNGITTEQQLPQEEFQYQEGGRRYVTHLMAERNRGVIQVLKNNTSWLCDICDTKFADRYGCEYIEAHHKIPISTYSSKYVVNPQDFVLLCPNCHKAVHIYMRMEDLDYQQIKSKLCGKRSGYQTKP